MSEYDGHLMKAGVYNVCHSDIGYKNNNLNRSVYNNDNSLTQMMCGWCNG